MTYGSGVIGPCWCLTIQCQGYGCLVASWSLIWWSLRMAWSNLNIVSKSNYFQSDLLDLPYCDSIMAQDWLLQLEYWNYSIAYTYIYMCKYIQQEFECSGWLRNHLVFQFFGCVARSFQRWKRWHPGSGCLCQSLIGTAGDTDAAACTPCPAATKLHDVQRGGAPFRETVVKSRIDFPRFFVAFM